MSQTTPEIVLETNPLEGKRWSHADGCYVTRRNNVKAVPLTSGVRHIMSALQAARLLRGRSVKDVAKAGSIAPITLSKWERWEGAPDTMAVMRMSIYLGLDGLGFINEHDVMAKARSSPDQATYGFEALRTAMEGLQRTHRISQGDVQAMSEHTFRELGCPRGGLNAVQTADLVRGFDIPLTHMDMKAYMVGLGGLTLTKHTFQDIDMPLWRDLTQWLDPTGLRARSAHLGARTPPHRMDVIDALRTPAQPDSDDDGIDALLGDLDD